MAYVSLTPVHFRVRFRTPLPYLFLVDPSYLACNRCLLLLKLIWLKAIFNFLQLQ